MSMKIIDIKDSVYQICSAYPEMIQILEELGFSDIAKPGMLNTVGRFMTLDKGAKLKHLDLDEVTVRLGNYGYQIKKEMM
jgi:hypothetical protein